MNQASKASIVAIGTELLIGQTVDTNSGWIGRELNKLGIWVNHNVSVSDDEGEMIHVLDYVRNSSSSIVILTGGLGSTSDDITKRVLARYLGSTETFLDKATLRRIEHFFHQRGRDLTDLHRLQAYLLEGCTPIPNDVGTSPGMWFDLDGFTLIAMPGVPYEMKAMMRETVLPQIASRTNEYSIEHQHFLTIGMGESDVAKRLESVEKQLPSYMTLSYLPSVAHLKLRLTAKGKRRFLEDLQQKKKAAQLRHTIQARLKDILVASEEITLEQLIGRKLKTLQKTIGTAESCTGGYISHLLTSVAGASDYYVGSTIAYSYDVKERILDVPHSILGKYGAVSEETVRCMAQGALDCLQSNYTIAVTGIMGPKGGMVNKPLGTVWIAVGNREQLTAKKFTFGKDRTTNIYTTAYTALTMFYQFLLRTQNN